MRHRRGSWVVAAALALAALSACSGSSLAPVQSSPTITAAGRHYTFSSSHVPKKKWPNPCTLLTRSSGAAALGTAISVRRFHTSCYYTPGSNAYPTLTITLLGVGTGSGRSYRQTSALNKGANRTSVTDVGRSAYLHSVRHLPASRLNVLTRYAHFAVTVQSPQGQQLSNARAHALLIAVGKVVAKAFRG